MYLKLLSYFPECLGKAVQAGNNDPLINERNSQAGKGIEKAFAKAELIFLILVLVMVRSSGRGEDVLVGMISTLLT